LFGKVSCMELSELKSALEQVEARVGHFREWL
jgi:hypothetical protein